jgi:hypothetical protein
MLTVVLATVDGVLLLGAIVFVIYWWYFGRDG